MDWEAFIALLRLHFKKTIAGVIVIASAAFSAGGYFFHAEQCHEKGNVAFEGVETLTRIHEDSLLRKQAQDEHLAALCLAGDLPGKPVTCAKALAGLEAAR